MDSASNEVQEDIKELRNLLVNLFKTKDFGLRKFIFKDIDKTLLNFYNKAMTAVL